MKELWKKPYGKAVYFFGFYLIFFIALGIISNTMGKSTTSNYNSGTNSIRVSALKKYNYTFDYKVVLDDVTYSYEGSKVNNTLNYTYDGKEYYNNNGKSYNKEDLKEIDNPIKFNKFLDEEAIVGLLKSSYIESKTTYDSGAASYNLLISSNTLNKIISNKDTDVEEIPNRIKASIDENKLIKSVNYNLDSYCKLNELCTNNLNIIISFDNYSDVN